MRKITYLMMALLLSLSSAMNAQNLIDYWNGYTAAAGLATGAGSQAKYWGWSTSPATAEANWNTANGTSSIRYFDNATGYDAGRILYIRWDGVVATTGKYYFKLDSINVDHLTGGHTYTFKFSYCWNSNASAPTISSTISAAKDGSGAITPLSVGGTNVTSSGTTVSFVCSTTSKSMRTGTITFMPTTDGDYYISFGANTASMCAIRDLSLIDNGDKYAGLLELQTQTNALTLGDVSAVTSDITLPTTAGTKGVKVKWASSNPAIVDSIGHVVQPAKYNKDVNMTATLSLAIGDTVFSNTKNFTVTVIGLIPTPVQVATWNFTSDKFSIENDTLRIADMASGFKGKLMNEARIRTIGTSEQFNTLYLGNGTGYFDMGQEIGEIIYTLKDFTMMGYFRVDDDYTNLSAAGNAYWNFGNSADIATDKNGWMYGNLNSQQCGISATTSPSTSASAAKAATIGSWHHIAFVQSGTTGTVYVDGVQVAQNVSMPTPSQALPKTGRTGTICNWLGRHSWAGQYLKKTMLYDFRVLSIPVSVDDMNFGYEGFPSITATVDKLNTAFAENPDYIAPELQTEANNLSLGDLSAVKSNITLPTKGTLDATVSITWKTTNNKLITTAGVVTRPNYYNYNDTLTATLMKNGQSTTKIFPATVIMNDNSKFNSDLLVKYDFSNVHDSIVTDVAEKHFTGTIKNQAKVHAIGLTTKYNVLSLGDSIGYFDMGPEIGKLMYNLTDYTVGAYYRIDTAYANLTKNGNFLFSFANGTSQMTDQNGYIIGSLLNQSVSISPIYYTAASGNQAVSFASAALKGGWHYFGYTQSGTTGTVYVDGMAVATGTITNLPKTTLPKNNNLGTPYNWIGRSCYASDVYLRKTLVYDFRLYSRALTDAEIQNDILNVGSTITALETAYAEDPTAVKQITNTYYKVTSSVGSIKLLGLSGKEKVSIVDIAGRRLNITNTNAIPAKAGVYIIKINEYITKVIVE